MKIFNLVYLDLIENDYHSKIWCKGTRIILKKSDKSNYSILKIYRIIMLSNYLNKVAEKIIVVQLFYTAEIKSVMKLICMQCWLQIYCLATVKSKDYQKFEWHWDVAWW